MTPKYKVAYGVNTSTSTSRRVLSWLVKTRRGVVMEPVETSSRLIHTFVYLDFVTLFLFCCWPESKQLAQSFDRQKQTFWWAKNQIICKYLRPIHPIMLNSELRSYLLFQVSQCDQTGRFLKVQGGKFSFQSSPNIWLILGYFGKHQFLNKNF